MKDSDHKKVGVEMPTWMSMRQWRELLALHGGVPQCAYTGKIAKEAKLVVDHILPRSKGGKNEISNYQFLCEEENRKKWAKEDKYWAQDFFYDKSHDPYGFRHAQYYLAYRKILDYAEHFQRPWSQINRVVHLLAWIAGAGKTISIHAICFALNQILRKNKGIAYPRVHRILVLAKEQAIRDQLAKELKEDVVAYKICKIPPRVGVVKSSDKLDNDWWLEQYDIVVSCVQQVWKQENDRPRDNIEQILGKFAVIFFDEPHFAKERVENLAELANRSLCFGLTSTPINAKGNVLESYVLFSQCGLREVYQEQKNLKYLSSLPEVIEQLKIVESVKIDSSRDFYCGERTLIEENPDSPDYNIQIEAARNVAGKVVSYMVDADRLCEKVYRGEISTEAAPHRDPSLVIPDLIYPMHAMISVSSKDNAQVLEGYLNKMFKSDLYQYPVKQGFRAEVVFSSGEDEEGKTVSGKKLDTDHPWLKCWRTKEFNMTQNGWELPEGCARLLIVVEMAREGINNPFCGVIGLGKRTQSIIEVIQRLIGRQIRSYTEEHTLGRLRVPPARLDTIKIWTHEAWDYPRAGDAPDNATRQRILDGLHFCEYMDEWLSELTTLEDLLEKGKELDPRTEVTDQGALTTEEKLGIAFDVGNSQLKGAEIPIPDIINDWCGQNLQKQRLGREWINLVQANPQEANTQLHHNVTLRTLHIIEHERPKNNPSTADLRWFYEVHNPGSVPLVEMLVNYTIDDTTKASIRENLEFGYKQYMRQFHAFADLPKVTDFKEIRTKLVSKLYGQLRYNEYNPKASFIEGEPKKIKEAAWRRIGYAVKTVLGLEKAEKGSEHDIPQYHAVLSDPSVVRSILGYARQELLRQFSPPLAKSLQISGVELESEID